MTYKSDYDRDGFVIVQRRYVIGEIPDMAIGARILEKRAKHL